MKRQIAALTVAIGTATVALMALGGPKFRLHW